MTASPFRASLPCAAPLGAILRLLIALFFLSPVLAAAQASIPIGRTLPVSGPIAVYGAAKKVGGEAYIERINREGGIRGRKIVLTTLDDRYDAAEAVKNVRKLDDDGVIAVLGTLGVPAVAAILPVIDQLRLPAVGLTSGAAGARNPVRRYGFPVRASYADEANAITRHLASLNSTRVIIVRQNNPFGNSVADNMLAALEAASIKPAADITLKIDGSDRNEVVAKLAAAEQVNVVFLAMQSPVAIPLIDAMRTGGVQSGANLFSISAVDTTQLAAALKDKARGIAISQIVPLTQTTLPLVREYIRDLKAINGGAPSFYGMEAYVEAKILVEGLRRAGNNITRDSLVTALESLGTFDLGGMLVTYGPGKREGSRFVDLIMVTRDGALIR